MNRLFLLPLLFVTFASYAAPGASTIDSNTINKWNDEALDLAYSEPAKALEIAERSYKEAQKIGFSRGEVRALLRMGIVYDVQSKDKQSISVYDKALQLARKTRDAMAIAAALNNLGLIHWKQNNLETAFNYLSQAYLAFEKIGAEKSMAKACNNIGLIYDEMNRTSEALSWYRKALAHYEHVGDTEVIYDVYANIGSVHETLGLKDSVQHYLQIAITGYRKSDNLYGLESALSNMGVSVRQEGKYEASIPLFRESLEIAKKMENTHSYISTAFNLSVAYKLLGRYAEQMSLLKEVLPLTDKLEANELQYKLYYELAEAYYRMGDIKTGRQYMGDANRVIDVYIKQVVNKNLSEAEKKFEVEEGRRKIAELERNKLAAELKITEKNNLLLALSILLIGGGLTTAIFIQRFRAKKEREKATAVLLERDKGLKAIIDAQETERIRIARELHDGVGHKLLALRMHIGSALTGAAAEENAEATGTILTEVMEEVRHASHQMMPKMLEILGCAPAIEDMLEKTLGKAGIEYIFETHDVDKRYDTRIEITIYRIAQELISNVIKHAAATSVYVHLMEAKQHLILLVEDNGKGIAAFGSLNEGIGMSTMKSRANAVNGEISIEAGKKNGTVARVKVPV